MYRMYIRDNIDKENLASAKPSGDGGRLSCTYALAMTRTGRSRLEHRHGWLDAGWPSVPVAKTQTGRLRLEHRQGWQGAVMARRDLPESYINCLVPVSLYFLTSKIKTTCGSRRTASLFLL